jgi:ABC-type transporter Mla MlaB component
MTIIKQNEDLELRLEGQITGPLADELWNQWQACKAGAKSIRLEMSGVNFVDGKGVSILKRLQKNGALISGCSLFVSALLTNEEV